MAAELLVTPSRASDSDNAIFAGAKWFFYASGTTTPQTVYADSALTTPLPNPVLADSGGKFPAIYFDSTKSYRGVLKDLDEAVTLYDIDPVNSGVLRSLSEGDGAGFVGFSFDESYGDGTLGRALQGVRSVLAAPYSAAADNVADDSAAIAAAAADGLFWTPDRLIKMDTAFTGDYKAVLVGTQFTGAHPLDEDMPNFGPATMRVIARGQSNSFVGAVTNTAPADTHIFPTAITAYANVVNPGNHVFALYAEARIDANRGVTVSEIDTFNFGGEPTATLPPNLGIGTPGLYPIALQLAADGDYDSSIGLHVTTGGQGFQKFLTGIYVNPAGIVNNGVFIDSESSSTYIPLVVKHSANKVGFHLQAVGTSVPLGRMIALYDNSGTEVFSTLQNGQPNYSGTLISTTVGVAGGASALPAAPSGYLLVKIGGSDVKMPFYAP